MIRLSLVIPAKDPNDPKLKELLKSIDAQDFPKEELEVLVITEGTSESAKAIGIKKAKGEVIGILASDNVLVRQNFLSWMVTGAKAFGATYPAFYHRFEDDNILNRYFALFGCNDPLAFYMKKCDRLTHLYGNTEVNRNATFGDNGFFVKKSLIEKTDLDNYFHIDNACELPVKPEPAAMSIIHNTGGNIFKFFAKRYRYGLQHAFNKNRRWHLVDFNQPKDVLRFIWFIVATLTVIAPLYLSIRGYSKIRDLAWFLHPLICLVTLGTYSLLIVHLGLRKLSQSLSAPLTVQRA